MVTVPMVSPFCRPLDVNAVEPVPPVNVVPYTLETLLAVMVRLACVILAVMPGWVSV